MKSLAEQLKKKYIAENLERSGILDYNEAPGAKTYFYDDLPNTVVDGYPFAADLVNDKGVAYGMKDWVELSAEQKKGCKLRFHYLPTCHEIYLGCTGSGKTTGCMEPQLRALSMQKNKPDLFITDPKGELFDHNAEHLKEQGYRLYVLNFKDLLRSDRWNPLLELYDTAILLRDVGKDMNVVQSGVPTPDLSLVAAPEKYNPKRGYITCDGKAFPSPNEYNVYLEIRSDAIRAQLDQLINEIANTMIQVRNQKDPTWEEGSLELLKGLFSLMLDFAVEDKAFTRDMMNIQTLHSYYITLRNFSANGDSVSKLERHSLFANGKHEKAFNLMATALNTSPRTMRSYCSVFESAMKDWFQANIYSMTTGQTIKIDESDETPFAVFLITRDYEKSDFRIAGLFIDWIYRLILKRNEGNPKARPLHYLLDEFGNIPAITDFENKIATARSRNIWFHLVLQSYAQLKVNYADNVDEVIIDNCNGLIFLGSQNADTKTKFSEQCGKHSIEKYSLYEASAVDLVEVPVIPCSKLDEMCPGEMFIKRFRTPVIKSEFIRSYILAADGYFPHFLESDGIEKCAPYTLVSYSNKRFIHKLPKNTSNNPWDF